MRQTLDDFTVMIASTLEPSSTTIAAVGAYVLVVATTLPGPALGLTSCYLAEDQGDTAVSHLHLGPGPEHQIAQRVVEAALTAVTHVRTCLLDHAAELQAQIAAVTNQPVRVDVGTRALDQAARAWEQAS